MSIPANSDLEELLNRLDDKQTRQLVQALVAEEPELIDAIEHHVSLMAARSELKSSLASDRKEVTIDVSSIRREVKHILRYGIQALEEGYEEDPFGDDLLPLIEQGQDFARIGEYKTAIAVLEAITTAYAQEYDDLMDCGGDCYSIEAELDSAWTETILTAEISEAEAVDLQVMLEAWQDEVNLDFAMSLEALRQRWDYEPLQEVLQGKSLGQFWEGIRPEFANNLALIRLQILSRQNRDSEYLNLALAEGLTLQYLTRLIALGRVEEAMTSAKTRLDTAETAFGFAKALRESEHLSEALEIAKAGLNLPGNCLYELAYWTSRLAQELGDNAAALNASILAFEQKPSFEEYRLIENLAGETWDELKPKLIKVLRKYQTWGADEAKVDIFLYEGLINDAIATVSTKNYCPDELVHRVMKAAIPYEPEWVIENAKYRAEPIMTQGKADRYDNAIKWLAQVRAAYFELKQHSEWSSYRSQLKVTYGRKRKLMELLKQLP
jgi:uncharacterized Zn finger protein